MARAAFFKAKGVGSAEHGCNFVSRTLTTLIKKIKETSRDIITGVVKIHIYPLSFIQQLQSIINYVNIQPGVIKFSSYSRASLGSEARRAL